MKTLSLVLLVLCLAAVPVKGDFSEQELIMRGEEVLNLLREGKYAEIPTYFNKTLRDQLSPQELQEIWETLPEQVGEFEEVLAIQVMPVQDHKVVVLSCSFPVMNLDLQLSFDQKGEIAGFFLTPSQYQGEYTPPSYAEQDKFTEEEVEFGQDPWKLPGKLTLPAGEGPWPVVIIIGGSGPTDADGSLGPNRPYKDMAWGFGSDGVAAFRFAKRTHVFQQEIAGKEDFTVQEEYVEDVLAAIAYLQERDEIDLERIFLAGHSQGGMMLPQIAEKTDIPRGLIFLAAPARALEDLILEQYNYLVELEGRNEEMEKQLQKIAAQVEKIKDPDLSPAIPPEELLGIEALYWLDLREYDQLETVQKIEIPMLFIQGGRDYQVTDEDYSLWQKALANRNDVIFEFFPELNHIFHTGEGMAVPGEYLQPGYVDSGLLERIIKWVENVE